MLRKWQIRFDHVPSDRELSEIPGQIAHIWAPETDQDHWSVWYETYEEDEQLADTAPRPGDGDSSPPI